MPNAYHLLPERGKGAVAGFVADGHDANLAELGVDRGPGFFEVGFSAAAGDPIVEEAGLLALDAVLDVALNLGRLANAGAAIGGGLVAHQFRPLGIHRVDALLCVSPASDWDGGPGSGVCCCMSYPEVRAGRYCRSARLSGYDGLIAARCLDCVEERNADVYEHCIVIAGS
jgi:hypothetical protein